MDRWMYPYIHTRVLGKWVIRKIDRQTDRQTERQAVFDFLFTKTSHRNQVDKGTSDGNITIQYNLNGSNTDGSFTVDDSNSFFSTTKFFQ